MGERRFRIMGGPSVPWRLVEPYEDNAKANHDQTLERLNERGGLGPGELWCIVHGKRWREQPPEDEALAWLTAWLKADEIGRLTAENASLRAEAASLRDVVERQSRRLTIYVLDRRRQLPPDVLNDIADSHTMRDRMKVERDQARAELARVVPIVEAAKAWCRSEIAGLPHPLPYRRADEQRLLDAIDATLTAKDPER